MRAELDSLRAVGHEVVVFGAHTDVVEGPATYPLRAALRVASGRGRHPLAGLNDFAPDVVHIHNLFPNFGRRWVGELDAPVVHTVHNYRPLCANGRLLRDGEICTLCPDGRRWAGVRYACYRDSRLATLPIAWANRAGPAADPLLSRADHLIMLSDRQREIYGRAGIATDRIAIWPNFLPERLDPGPDVGPGGPGWLFVGRLSEEKGILRLLERWPDGETLRVVGDGPLRERVITAAGPGVEVLGPADRDDVLRLMKMSIGLIFPSLWLEPSATPLVYVEALAAGLPVLVFPPSPVTGPVRDAGTGAVVTWADDLDRALDEATSSFVSLRAHCRSVFERDHTQAGHARRASRTYERALRARARS